VNTPDRKTRPERLAAAVPPASGMVWAATEIMHWAGLHAGTDASIATTVVSAAAGLAAARGKAPAALPAWAAAAGYWFAAAETFGPLHWWPAPVLTIAWAGITLAASRAAQRHHAVTAAREKREARENWLMIRNRWGLGGSHLLDFNRTRLGELYTLNIKGTGNRASYFTSQSCNLAEDIAESEDLPVNRVQILRHHLAGRIRLSIRRIDPWADAMLHPLACDDHEVTLPAGCSILDEVPVGQDPETGDVLTVPLYDKVGGKNISVTGIKGAGKGVLLDNISERVTAARDAIQVRVNTSFKGYAEAASWGPACHLTAFGPEEEERAVKVLLLVVRIAEWRARTYKRGQYKPSPDDPAIIVIVDESDSAIQNPLIRAALGLIATKGREYGVSYVHAGQRGTREYNDPKARSQDDVYCTGAVRNANEARHAAGSGGGPDMATYGEGQPGVWKVERLGGGVASGRTWVFSADPDEHAAEVEQIAAERAFTQPDLPEACKDYLGDIYREMIGTDVFAVFARQNRPDAHPAAGDDDTTSPAAPAQTAAPQDQAAAPSAPSPAGRTAVAEQDPLEEMLKLDLDPGTAARVESIHAKLAAASRDLNDLASTPRPASNATPDALAARSEQQWREAESKEKKKIPVESRARLLEMLSADGGTTSGMVADEFGISKYRALLWLRVFRSEGAARMEGEKRGTRWLRVTSPPPPGGNSDAE
jgi:hypothetical protein